MELIGRRFGHIRITDVVGQGGMGDVYAGYDEKLDRKVALKVLHSENRLDAEARERLLREARALSKLDHPNICRIHDYIESEDVDVLVLEYIDGHTLQDAMIDRQLSRGEKLRIATSVAEVLVAAHRVGIIHRDLKPENVMLTKHGEVKVLDFGLARWLNVLSTSKRIRAVAAADVSAAPLPVPDESDHAWFSYTEEGETMSLRYEAPLPRPKRSFLRTAVGITMGTPLYMSPEQARGEELTTASDLFAFGLLLQALFTGVEPHPPGLTAREVILRAARGETLPVQGVSGDIASLIQRLKQFAPADRPTAVETVARLRFLADKPRRIARRSAIAFVVFLMVFGGWRYTVDLARERTAALNARAEAEKRRAEVENLLEFMLGDLRKKLDEVGRLDILDDVGNRALLYVESLRPEAMSVDELTRNAKALNQLGEVRSGQGKTPEALDLFRRSLRLADEAVRRKPRNGDALMVLGATHFWIGDGHRRQGDHAAALRHMREYMKVGDALATLDPKRKEYQLERAYGHSGVAFMLEAQGHLREAREHYEVSLAVKQELARQAPADADAQAELARAFNKLAVLVYKQGDVLSARGYSRREVEIYRQLLARYPEQAQWKMRLSNSLTYLARALGDGPAASALWREALAIFTELADRDPSNVDWQRNLPMTMYAVATQTAALGNDAEAIRLCRDALIKIEDVVRSAPTRTAFKVDAAQIRSEYGRLLVQSGDSRGIPFLRDSVRELARLRTDRDSRYQYARSCINLGEATSDDTAFRHAESELAPLVVGSSNPDELFLWSRTLIHRRRHAEARDMIARLRQTGYSTAKLEQLCAENGC
jgi:eukaryotic-like serine/threonine-protein kinase